jgi:hypothetical protein
LMVWDKWRFGVAPRVNALDWWREFIVANNIRLVVFDTLAHFLRPELDKVRSALNAYDYTSSVLERVAQVANETGCTFVFVHHDRKGEGETDEQRVLGTTALTAAADVVLQLQPVGDDAGVTTLKAMGNAIDEQALYFTIQPDFWLEPTERPAVTKEERAANAIEGYLRLQEEAKRKELERHLQEIGLAESLSAAEKLVTRALSLLQSQGKVIRTRRGTYKLASNRGHSDTSISDVHVVRNSSALLDNSDNLDNLDMSEMSEMSEVSEMSEMSETPHRFRTTRTTRIMSSESSKDNGQDWHWDWLASDTPILPELVTPENSPIACHHDENVSNLGVIVEPSVTEPSPETSNSTSSDEVRSIDTEASNKTPDDTSLSSSTKPDRLACLCGGELRLFGKFYQCLRCDSPRIAACRYCGKVLQLTSDGHAECVSCGLPYLFDRARRLWLADLDAF